MHILWVELSCGKLKSNYRYSKKLAYNNFPFPTEYTDYQKEKVKKQAQEILDIRAKYPNESLADLYNPLLIPSDLKKIHEKVR